MILSRRAGMKRRALLLGVVGAAIAREARADQRTAHLAHLGTPRGPGMLALGCLITRKEIPCFISCASEPDRTGVTPHAPAWCSRRLRRAMCQRCLPACRCWLWTLAS